MVVYAFYLLLKYWISKDKINWKYHLSANSVNCDKSVGQLLYEWMEVPNIFIIINLYKKAWLIV